CYRICAPRRGAAGRRRGRCSVDRLPHLPHAGRVCGRPGIAFERAGLVQAGALRIYVCPAPTVAVPPLPWLDAVLPSGRGDAMTDTMPTRSTSGLLVSVRDAEEVDVAILGGAGLIDVKEPTRGALGRAEATVIAAVV